MKFNKDTIDVFINSLQNGAGRVRACEAANISYQTFLNWIEDPEKIEFFEAVKKAEKNGDDKIKDICKRRVIEDKSWQSAAWWLERKYKEEFGSQQNINHQNNGGKFEQVPIVVANEADKTATTDLLNKLGNE